LGELKFIAMLSSFLDCGLPLKVLWKLGYTANLKIHLWRVHRGVGGR